MTYKTFYDKGERLRDATIKITPAIILLLVMWGISRSLGLTESFSDYERFEVCIGLAAMAWYSFVLGHAAGEENAVENMKKANT